MLTSKTEFEMMITSSHKRQKWQRLIAGRLAAAAEFYITTTAQETSYWTRERLNRGKWQLQHRRNREV